MENEPKKILISIYRNVWLEERLINIGEPKLDNRSKVSLHTETEQKRLLLESKPRRLKNMNA